MMEEGSAHMICLTRRIAYVLLLLFFGGCLQESEEVTPPDEETTIPINSDLANHLINIARLDGSADNILDNASCLTVIYPVDVLLKGTHITLESAEDLPSFIARYEEEITNRNQFHLRYPIRVKKSDYSTLSVANKRELELLNLTCTEGGDDEDIECLDFSYPLKVATYDQLNQLAEVQTIESDEALFHLFSTATSDLLISLTYPVELITSTGSGVNATSNSELKLTIEGQHNSCDEQDAPFDQGSSTNSGYFKINLTDAPFPSDLVDKVWITMSKLEIKRKAGGNNSTFITLFERDTVLNLLALSNGITATLAETPLPSGAYQFFRLYVSESSIVMKDGEVFELKIPGGLSSGIKIMLDTDLFVQAADTTEVLLDFDVSQSFVTQGNINSPQGIKGFLFKPVIHAININQAGIIEGTVSDPDAAPVSDVQVAVLNASSGTQRTATFTNEDGQFKILGLPPGRYSLLLERADYQSVSSETFSVRARETSTFDFVLKAN